MPHDENPRAHNAAEEGRVANLWDLKALMLSRGVCIQEQVMNSKTISRPSVLRALSGGDPLTGRAEQTSNPGQRGGQKEPHVRCCTSMYKGSITESRLGRKQGMARGLPRNPSCPPLAFMSRERCPRVDRLLRNKGRNGGVSV